MMTEPVAIRRAGPQDVPGCAKVVNDWIDATDWMARAYEPEVIEGFIRDAFDKREIWISGEPVDAYLSFNPQTSQIGALYCRKTGRGVGKVPSAAETAGLLLSSFMALLASSRILAILSSWFTLGFRLLGTPSGPKGKPLRPSP